MCNYNSEIQIGFKKIGYQNSPYIIAEAGSNFNQKLDKAYKLIDIAAESGADAVKFQLFQLKVRIRVMLRRLQINSKMFNLLIRFQKVFLHK